MKVSVVMAVYNALPYLEEALSSVLSQTFKDSGRHRGGRWVHGRFT